MLRSRLSIVLALALWACLFSNTFAQKAPLWERGSNYSRMEAVERLREKARTERERAYTLARQKGVPVEIKMGDKVAVLHRYWDGRFYYRTTFNVNAAISTAVNRIRNVSPYNLNGLGMTVGVWDGGWVRSSHQEFGSRVTLGDSGGSVGDHPTHVAGTIGAAGVDADALGMAPSIYIRSFDWTYDTSEMADQAADTAGGFSQIMVSNHSYGFVGGYELYGINDDDQWVWMWFGDSINDSEDESFGQYSIYDVEWDELVYTAGYYLPVVSSGNDRNNNPQVGDAVAWYEGSELLEADYNPSVHPPGDGEHFFGGYDCIMLGSLAKNILLVGAVNDAVSNGSRNLNNATQTSFSSWGPADDGRIKPDVVGNGYELYSSLSTNDQAYGSGSGTSMAAPNVTGSLVLVLEYIREQFGQAYRASTLKGLIIHTADDVGNAGPDYQNGWGLINAEAAVQQVFLHAQEPDMGYIQESYLDSSTSQFQMEVQTAGEEPLRLTLCWTDPAGTAQSGVDDPTPVLVNDLDMELVGPSGNTFRPYVLNRNIPTQVAGTGDNDVDNVEQIYLAAPEAGTYTLTIDAENTLVDRQHFSLILSGQTDEVVQEVIEIANVAWSEEMDLDGDGYRRSARLNWTIRSGLEEDAYVYSVVRYRKANSSDWTIHGATDLGVLEPGDSLTTSLMVSGLYYGKYDFQVEVFQEGLSESEDLRGPDNTSNLKERAFEPSQEDIGNLSNVPAVLNQVRWIDTTDQDGDAYYSSARLEWDANVSDGQGSLYVFERVYWKQSNATNWNYFLTTPQRLIVGTEMDDAYSVPVSGLPHGSYDWRIDIYRIGISEVDVSADGWTFGVLSNFLLEKASEDTSGMGDVYELAYVNTDFTSADVAEGEFFGAWMGVVNEGNQTVSQAHVSLFLSTDGDLNTLDDYYLGEQSFANLEPGKEAWVSWTAAFPSLDSAFYYQAWLLYIIDSREAFDERDESNNVVLVKARPILVRKSRGTLRWINAFGANQGWDRDRHPRFAEDVSGDGALDLVGFGDKGVVVSMSRGNAFSTPLTWVFNFGGNQGWSTDRHVRTMADVNGDGMMDIVGFGERGVMVSTSKGFGFDGPGKWVENFGVQQGWQKAWHPRTLGDVNGDGRDDIVGFGDRGVLVGLSTGYYFEDGGIWLEDFGRHAGWYVGTHPRMLADVNGDGRDDVVGFGDKGVFVALAEEGRFSDAFLWLKNFGGRQGWSVENYPRTLADVNGDGMADVLGFGENDVLVSLSRGDSFAEATTWLADNMSRSKGWSTSRHERLVADFSQDGAVDIVGFGNIGVFVSYGNQETFSNPPLWVLPEFGADQNWSKSRHLRFVGNVDNLGALDIVGFFDDGVYVHNFF